MRWLIYSTSYLQWATKETKWTFLVICRWRGNTVIHELHFNKFDHWLVVNDKCQIDKFIGTFPKSKCSAHSLTRLTQSHTYLTQSHTFSPISHILLVSIKVSDVNDSGHTVKDTPSTYYFLINVSKLCVNMVFLIHVKKGWYYLGLVKLLTRLVLIKFFKLHYKRRVAKVVRFVVLKSSCSID